MAVLLALASALSWGTGDFLGGVLSRRTRTLIVLAFSQLTGLTFAVVLCVLFAGSWPGLGELWPACAAGAAGVIGLACFYNGLAIGMMSVVAPVSSTAAAVPVLVGVATGERPGPLQLLGITAAIAGVVLTSREAPQPDDAHTRRAANARLSVLLALGGALGFGLFFVGLDSASDASVLWALLCARAVSVSCCFTALLLLPGARVPRAGDRVRVAAVGLLDTGANGLFAIAATKGLLSVTSVLGSLYPLSTVLFARVLLHERLARVQQVGVGLAFTGVALIAGG